MIYKAKERKNQGAYRQQPASFFASDIQKFADRKDKCLSKLKMKH